MDERVEVRSVVRQYATKSGTVRAVDGADLRADAGEMIALLGASGSGKTTLLNIIAGLDVPDSGSVMVHGIALNGLSEKERARIRLEHIAIVFQDDNLIAEFTARENITIPLLAREMSLREAARRADGALDELGIGELGDRLPADMSGGQRQRVGIARALAGEQSVLLADEPTGALDSGASRALFERLAGLAHDHDVCVLVATHDPLCSEYADRIVNVRDGRILE
ncbi:ABC transporter ATP-binding protein [Acidipropionibacterium jensenii]|uniref:ABC transporter ATP-binding protein n=1 Tax=Acidipropionibacterium jensenii TaxID=1749 RepID=UPI0026494656|nr:ABC transporter ATP-binding protein [Acidipropionibacterium jensenii]MDN5977844.1 ABC transporter ATP-binding protein [Acidipropionibacterium jensenii]MDN5996810.1 ABC transporter ATP-binding protein [Acidipropionibacterium jensenii]MDN6021230.1 ABC transporter ATP-binding protein [Acidipropionibacterium jensenii]MDN6427134.1 ABC transporter ATP-binding protein [Acidipropionibacterium jensenii]MDN6441639.1 ABC transporter ATP-binding protein [Acidipropionibacterium jensenii]